MIYDVHLFVNNQLLRFRMEKNLGCFWFGKLLCNSQTGMTVTVTVQCRPRDWLIIKQRYWLHTNYIPWHFRSSIHFCDYANLKRNQRTDIYIKLEVIFYYFIYCRIVNLKTQLLVFYFWAFDLVTFKKNIVFLRKLRKNYLKQNELIKNEN